MPISRYPREPRWVCSLNPPESEKGAENASELLKNFSVARKEMIDPSSPEKSLGIIYLVRVNLGHKSQQATLSVLLKSTKERKRCWSWTFHEIFFHNIFVIIITKHKTTPDNNKLLWGSRNVWPPTEERLPLTRPGIQSRGTRGATGRRPVFR